MVLIGLLVGMVSKLVTPGGRQGGWIASMVLGVLGSVGMGLYARDLGWFEAEQTTGLFASMTAAIVVVVSYRIVTRPPKERTRVKVRNRRVVS